MDERSSSLKMPKRPYRQGRRAESQAETHRALARAAFELHESVGPAKATISAIAERAGVQRLTVYRHFPDDVAIFAACTAYSFEHDPPPNPESWRAITSPEFRLSTALDELYGYYERHRQLFINLYRDEAIPTVAKSLRRSEEGLTRGVTILAEGRTAGDRTLLLAALGHVLDFQAWRSLADGQRLDAGATKALALAFVAAAEGEPARG